MVRTNILLFKTDCQKSANKDKSLSESQATIGIDLGGTNTKVALFVDDTLLHAQRFSTHSYRTHNEILGDLLEAIRTLRHKAEREGINITALGLGVPATIDPGAGRTLVMPNFAKGWFDFGIVDYLEQATHLPTALINDARAFVLAESTLGAGQGHRNVFGMILGTGVGGGVVLNGRVHFGKGALAGEIGHHIVEPNGLKCGCGSIGCLETVASAPALVASVIRAYLHGRSPVLHDLTEGNLSAVTAKTITQAARQGDAACREALERVAMYLGVATANVATLIAPECIVLGGGLAGASDFFFPVIEKTWRKYLQVMGEHLPELKVAKLGQSGVLGAALYARHQPH